MILLITPFSVGLSVAVAQENTSLSFLKQGKENYDSGEYKKAVENLTFALKSDTLNKEIWRSRGNAYKQLGDYVAALSDYEHCVKLDYSDAASWMEKARINELLAHHPEATDDFEEVIFLNPKNKHAWYERGSIKARKYMMFYAIQDFSEAIKIDNRFVPALMERAFCYLNQGDIELGLEDLARIIELEPNNIKALFSRAFGRIQFHNYEGAIADFSTIIALDPSMADAYNGRGLAQFMAKSDDKAMNDFDELIKRFPEYDKGWYNRGLLYERMSNIDHAISDFTRAINIDKKKVNALCRRGNLYDLSGEFDKANADFARVLAIDSTNKYAMFGMARLYSHTGDYFKAVASYSKLIRKDSTYADAYIGIISPLARTAQFNAAKFYYNKYRSLSATAFIEDKKWAFYKYFIDAILDDVPNGSYMGALSTLDVAIKEYGNKSDMENRYEYLDVLALKGYVLQKLGKADEAADIYKQALLINSRQTDLSKMIKGNDKKANAINVIDRIPPSIQLLSPNQSEKLLTAETGMTDIIGKVKDASGISWIKVNGKVVQPEDDGVFLTRLKLITGMNKISVSAMDKQKNLASREFTVFADVGSMLASSEAKLEDIIPVNTMLPQYFAIIIAQNDYQDPNIKDLANPINDAREIKAILHEHYNFADGNIDTLFNSSRDEILQTILQRCNNRTENDNVFIFYAGHGTAIRDRFGNSDSYWIPSSAKKDILATYISADEIYKAIKPSYAKHILIIADACFSGSNTRGLGKDAPIAIRKLYEIPSRTIMTSGIKEVPDNSLFAYYLKKRLVENREKYLTGKKLFDSFQEIIIKNTKLDAIPGYRIMQGVGDEGGEFIFTHN